MAESRQVYLDHSATTPVDPRVVDAMMPYLTGKFGNPSSVHFFGQEARAAVDRARRDVATLVGAKPNEIVFVSGGTEANNLAIRGVCEMSAAPAHLITSDIEHPSVRGSVEALETKGWKVTRVPAGASGVVSVDDVRSALRPDTVLVSVMLANNEIGTIQPIEDIAEIVRDEKSRGNRRLLFHTDAVQAAGRIALNVDALGCDLLTISSHKIYGPKGAGALYVRRGVRLAAQNIGGHQEREKRAGTEAVPSLVGFGTAARLAMSELAVRLEHDRKLRDLFEEGVTATIADIVFNGDRSRRLPHLSNISFRFIEGEGLLISLDLQGVAVSTGSACSSGTLEPSPVIRALGRNDELARGSIRFSFGKDNSEEDVTYVLQILERSVNRLRHLSPLANQRTVEVAS